MTKNIYIIRHCEATGQLAEAPLTEKGFRQASALANFLSGIKVDKVISSPYVRALQSIQPFAEENNLEVEIDERLSERILSSVSLYDWREKLEATFYDLDLKYEGGESSKEAMNRINEVVKRIITNDCNNTILVAHGGIISLLLHSYDKNFGFEQWSNLTNPDVFQLRISENGSDLKHIRDTRV